MKSDRSAALFERARRVTPGGVHSPVRAFRGVGGVPRFIREALEAIKRGDISAQDFVTEEITLNDLPQAFERMKSRSGEIKVAVRP